VALPDDQARRLRCYRNALNNWRYEGFIEFRPRVESWLRKELALSGREVRQLLAEFVAQGGRIDEQVETRPEYVSFEFHYDLRVTIDGRRIYFETILLSNDPDDPDDPRIEIVSVRDA
jgi:hypothetical protein